MFFLPFIFPFLLFIMLLLFPFITAFISSPLFAITVVTSRIYFRHFYYSPLYYNILLFYYTSQAFFSSTTALPFNSFQSSSGLTFKLVSQADINTFAGTPIFSATFISAFISLGKQLPPKP